VKFAVAHRASRKVAKTPRNSQLVSWRAGALAALREANLLSEHPRDRRASSAADFDGCVRFAGNSADAGYSDGSGCIEKQQSNGCSDTDPWE
jgi:hypothetical protein